MIDGNSNSNSTANVVRNIAYRYDERSLLMRKIGSDSIKPSTEIRTLDP
jgi:hypothetical protein